jgi:hypothetical protein
MPIGYRNLSGHVKGLLDGSYPDIGQRYFIIDSDYRTDAQGWTRADGTGPLDIYDQRNRGYVFRTGDYANDALCLQAAIDEVIDFRGDTVLLTPGNYSIGTALAVNAAGMRLVGPPVRNPKRGLVTITGTIGNTLTVSVDDVELAFFRAVPLTAAAFLSVANGADGGLIRYVKYDADGVTASTSTEFLNAAAATEDWLVEDCYFSVDDLQGDCFTWATARHWQVQFCEFMTKVASYATAFTLATNCQGNSVNNCYFNGDADGTYTNIFTGAANENGQLSLLDNRVNGTALATATAIETGFGTTTDIELAENYLTGDATTQGGVLIVLA